MKTTLQNVKPIASTILEPTGRACAFKLSWIGKFPGQSPDKIILGEIAFDPDAFIEDIEASIRAKFPAANWFNATMPDGRWLCSGSI